MQATDQNHLGPEHEHWLTLVEAARWVIARTLDPLPDTWHRVPPMRPHIIGLPRPNSASQLASFRSWPGGNTYAASLLIAKLRGALESGEIQAFGIVSEDASSTPIPPAAFFNREINHIEGADTYKPYDVIVVERARVFTRWPRDVEPPKRGRPVEFPYEKSLPFIRTAARATPEIAFNSKNGFTVTQLVRDTLASMIAARGGSRSAPSAPTIRAHVQRWVSEGRK